MPNEVKLGKSGSFALLFFGLLTDFVQFVGTFIQVGDDDDGEWWLIHITKNLFVWCSVWQKKW